MQRAQLELNHVAASHRLPSRLDKLDELMASLRELERHLRQWARRCRDLESVRKALAQASESQRETEAEKIHADGVAADAVRRHRGLRTRLDVLEAAVGAEFRDVMERLAAAEKDKQAN